MKKALLSLFVAGCMICCLPISAQESTTQPDSTKASKPEKKAKFWIGPKFGLDLHPVKLNEIGSQLSANYQLGIMVQYGRTLYLQPEIYYASYKDYTSAVVYGHNGTVNDPTKSVNFLKMPIFVGLKFLDLGLFSLHLKGGPSFTYRLNGKNSDTEDSFAWQVAAGVDILGFITTDVRYTLNDESLGDQINHFSRNTSMVNLTVGLRLR